MHKKHIIFFMISRVPEVYCSTEKSRGKNKPTTDFESHLISRQIICVCTRANILTESFLAYFRGLLLCLMSAAVMDITGPMWLFWRSLAH